jgi:hypothetical protein
VEGVFGARKQEQAAERPATGLEYPGITEGVDASHGVTEERLGGADVNSGRGKSPSTTDESAPIEASKCCSALGLGLGKKRPRWKPLFLRPKPEPET